MRRGTVVWVDVSDTSPPEMGKVQHRARIWPLRGLLGELSYEHLAKLDECLEAYLR